MRWPIGPIVDRGQNIGDAQSRQFFFLFRFGLRQDFDEHRDDMGADRTIGIGGLVMQSLRVLFVDRHVKVEQGNMMADLPQEMRPSALEPVDIRHLLSRLWRERLG